MPTISAYFRVSSGPMILPLVLLSACGSTSGGGASPDLLNFSSTQSAVDEGLVLDNLIEVSSRTPIDQLPSGSVSYNGFIVVASEVTDFEVAGSIASDPLFAVGRMTVNADFGSGAITGVGDHFIDGNDNQIGGELVLSAETGFMDDGPTAFSGSVVGEILPANGFIYDYDLDIDGSIRGENAEFIAGGGDGNFDLTTDGVTETIPFGIGFVAQQ
jgi:hypothetical protein